VTANSECYIDSLENIPTGLRYTPGLRYSSAFCLKLVSDRSTSIVSMNLTLAYGPELSKM